MENKDIVFITDEVTGEKKELDVSLIAASRTLEDIKRIASLINDNKSKPEIVMERLVEVERMILDKARYMQRLYSIKIKIFGEFFEIVNEFDKFKTFKDNFIYNFYITKVNKALERRDFGSLDARLDNMLDAIRSIERGIAIVGRDELLSNYRNMIIEEYNSVKPKNRALLI